jgi:hypothetical protein
MGQTLATLTQKNVRLTMITQTDLDAMLAHMPTMPAPATTTALQPAQGTMTVLYDWLKKFAKPSALRRVRVAVFVANNAAFLTAIKNPAHALNKLCLSANADLRAYDLGDSAQGNTAQAFTYGLLAMEEGVDLLIPFAVTDQPIVLGKCGAGLDGLQQINNIALAAMCGAIVAAGMAQMPVLVDDDSGAQAAKLLHSWQPNIVHHIFNLQQHDIWQMQRAPAEQALLLAPVLRSLLTI